MMLLMEANCGIWDRTQSHIVDADAVIAVIVGMVLPFSVLPS